MGLSIAITVMVCTLAIVVIVITTRRAVTVDALDAYQKSSVCFAELNNEQLGAINQIVVASATLTIDSDGDGIADKPNPVEVAVALERVRAAKEAGDHAREHCVEPFKITNGG